ncbi:hypothetical protein [Clostridium cellulovorans]|uniref:DNA repair ATPase n=1 Tax=Clostridium cellulovorans (strain ATCC 35296 / DSM 3052 / OCM 3 / 743B) TaxID=573061 RepID=D9SLP9_CLOC7|nr:hypothetical protein [Clostridium cellulovorans]ADL53686.1 DNA repair ATPase [Clostridium cellulovorans 743B]
MDEDRRIKLEELSQASPLEVTKKLQEFEIYDRRSSQEIIDEVYAEFESGERLTDSILKPVFMSIVDGLLEATSLGKAARRKGLTASRVLNECEQFSYHGQEQKETNVNGYTEYKKAREYTYEYGKENRDKYDRGSYENQNAMSNYKKKAVNSNGSNKLLSNEYTGERNLYAYRNNPDKRRNDGKYDYQAEPDHIVPLKQIHTQFKGNYALSTDDIKRIANSNDNLALTSAALNGRKLDSSNSNFINEQEKLKKEGKDYFEVDGQTKTRMIQMEKEAQRSINSQTNETVVKNLTGKGIADRKDRKSAYAEAEEKKGSSLTSEERAKIDEELSKYKTKEIYGTAIGNAADQAKEYAVGNVILFIVKPLYFELKDIIKNGMIEGVGADSTIDALKIRFGRVKEYVLKNAKEFLGDSVLGFIKGFISSLIEGIISLFVGMFKQVLKLIKEGIKIFVQSAKILFGKDAKEMTPSQKGDAIIKIIGGSVIAIAGIGIEALLNKIGIGEPWSVVLSTMLSGIASALFMYLLDKVDLFSTKSEKRRDRIIEIFDERIKEIKDATDDFDIVVIDTLRRQRQEFEKIKEDLIIGLGSNSIDTINKGLYKMAKFYKIDLAYSNTREFVDYFDSETVIEL